MNKELLDNRALIVIKLSILISPMLLQATTLSIEPTAYVKHLNSKQGYIEDFNNKFIALQLNDFILKDSIVNVASFTNSYNIKTQTVSVGTNIELNKYFDLELLGMYQNGYDAPAVLPFYWLKYKLNRNTSLKFNFWGDVFLSKVSFELY